MFKKEWSVEMICPDIANRSLLIRDNIHEGIDIILYTIEGEQFVKSIRFDATMFSIEDIKEWLETSNLDWINIEEVNENDLTALLTMMYLN